MMKISVIISSLLCFILPSGAIRQYKHTNLAVIIYQSPQRGWMAPLGAAPPQGLVNNYGEARSVRVGKRMQVQF